MMVSHDDEDSDDFSPQDAFNMFTPIIYQPRSRDHYLPNMADAAPPGFYDDDDGLDYVTMDTSVLSGITFPGSEGGGPPLDLDLNPPPGVGVVNPPRVGDYGWIFDRETDHVVVPLLLAVIGLLAVVGNLLVLAALLGFRRMRTGPHLMLANLALADLVVVSTAVPTALAAHLIGEMSVSPLACRWVHYTIFVGVYVSMYTLVVLCVFAFFGELIHSDVGCGKPAALGRRNGRLGAGSPKPLSVSSAVVSSLIVWAAFAASHLTFVVQASDILFRFNYRN